MSFVDYGNSRPFYPPWSIPVPSGLGLSDDQRQTITHLQQSFDLYLPAMYRVNSYYTGEQPIRNLGISIPPELSALKTLTSWCRKPIDPVVDRMSVDCFRFNGQTHPDPDLEAAWIDSECDATQSIGYTEALVLGRGYVVVGAPVEAGGSPRITFDSPFSLTAAWDPRSGTCTAAVQSYWEGRRRMASIMLPNDTWVMAMDDEHESWDLVNHDGHNFGRVPVHRMVNSPRANQRDGVSEITPELMSITDAACRALQRLEVASEFYSLPQKVILGAAEADFVNADGSPKSGWSTYMSSLVALERDEEGNLPDIKQFNAYDPAVYTKVVDMYAAMAASTTSAPPQEFGLYTQGNPTSAEAWDMINQSRNKRADRKKAAFAGALRGAMRDVIRFNNKGVLPDSAQRVVVEWDPSEAFSLAVASDSLLKQNSAGFIPSESDVVLKRLGWSVRERDVLRTDLERDKAEQFLREAANNTLAMAERNMKVEMQADADQLTKSVDPQQNTAPADRGKPAA